MRGVCDRLVVEIALIPFGKERINPVGIDAVNELFLLFFVALVVLVYYLLLKLRKIFFVYIRNGEHVAGVFIVADKEVCLEAGDERSVGKAARRLGGALYGIITIRTAIAKFIARIAGVYSVVQSAVGI